MKNKLKNNDEKNKSILFLNTEEGMCGNCIFFKPEDENENIGTCDGVFKVDASDKCSIYMFSQKKED